MKSTAEPILEDDGEAHLAEERRVLRNVALRALELAGNDLTGLSRMDMAQIVVDLARDSERMSTIAGRFLVAGESEAVSLTMGESSMIRLVNAKARLSRNRASQLRRAGTAKNRLPSFHRALMRGQITLGHIDVITGLAARVNSQQLKASERDLAALAVLCTPEEFKAAVAEWEAIADPTEHLDAFIRAQASRHFVYGQDLFGLVHFSGTFGCLVGEPIIDMIETRAKQLKTQAPDIYKSQASHDALVEFILDPNRKGGPRAHLEILVPPDPENGNPSADAACTDLPARHTANPLPRLRCKGDRGFGSIHYAQTAGGTLIPRAVVTELATTGVIRFHVLTSGGHLAGDVATGRHFTARQRRMIRLRDHRCQHPGCRMPGRFCQYDHGQPAAQHGPSLVANGQLLCPLHHRWKHRDEPTPSGARANQFHDSPLVIQLE